MDKNEQCTYCGKPGHGKNAPARFRKKTCPGYGQTCEQCGRPNQLKKVCRSKDKPMPRPTPGSLTNESAIFDIFCQLSDAKANTANQNHTIPVDHHTYNQLNHRWTRQTSSTPQPFITLHATAHPEDYKTLGFKLAIHDRKTITLPAMADTGCQSCLAGVNVIQGLGLSKNRPSSNGQKVLLSLHTFLN